MLGRASGREQLRLREPRELPRPIAIVSVDVAAVSITFTIVDVFARPRGLLRTPPDSRSFAINVLATPLPRLGFLVSVPISDATSPDAATLSWLALIPIDAVLGRMRGPFEAADSG
jgi:hypothetical protein